MPKFQEYIQDQFNLKAEEYTKIKLLFLYSFFLGLFIAFYFVPANSNFLKDFGHLELPYAYVISGIVGLISISFYSFIQVRRKTKTLFLSAIFLMFFISIFERIILFLLTNSKLAPDVEQKYISYLNFFVFVWAWPFIALVATITGGLALRLFNLLEVKKFYGFINLGGVIAATFSYFFISLILRVLHNQFDLIIIGTIGLLGAAYILLYIYKKFPETAVKHIDRKIDKTKFRQLWKNKFIKLIFIGATLSAILIYITDFGFLVTVKENKDLLQNGTNGVAKFLSLVYGGLKVGELLISLLSGRILTKGGLRTGLIALPLLLTLIFMAAYIDARLYGYVSMSFLTVMTAGKMLERIVRRGIDDPAYNVIFQTLPEEKKLFIQTRVGIMQQSAIAIAGFMLVFLNFFLKYNETNFHIDLYTLYVLPFLIIALLVAMQLYKRYKSRIKEILAEKKLFKFEYIEKDIFANDTLKMFIFNEKRDASKFCTIVLAETNPRSLETYAAFLLKIDDEIIRKAILSNIDSTYNSKLVRVIEQVGDQISIKNKYLKHLFLNAFFKLDYTEINGLSEQVIRQYAFSDNTKKQTTAVKYLYHNEIDGDDDIILHLLNSKDRTIKFAAAKIAGRRKEPKLWAYLVEMLSDRKFNNVLVDILVEIGEPVLKFLSQFAKKEKNSEIIAKVLQILAKIGTAKAQRILVGFLDYPDLEIQHLAILSLQYSNFFAREDTIDAIKRKIHSVVSNIVWYLVSIKDLVRERNTLKVIQALDLERLNRLEELFVLLGFTQSPEIVELIKTNIVGENTIFALELIDNFIKPDIKKIILPLFEPIRLGQKIKRFKQNFHHQPIGFEKRLIDILLTHRGNVDVWSQTKALEVIAKILPKEEYKKLDLSTYKIKEPKNWSKISIVTLKTYFQTVTLPDALVIAALHPDELIFSTAIKILYDNDVRGLDSFVATLSIKKQKVLENLKVGKELLPEKIKRLRKTTLFYGIPEKSLAKLAQITVPKIIAPGDNLDFIYDNDEYVFIIVKGQMKYEVKGKEFLLNKNMVIINGLNTPKNIDAITSVRQSQIFIIKRFDFFNLLAGNNKIVINLLNTMKF